MIAVRNEKVAGDIAAGATQKEVAEKIGVTPQRVGQIMKEKPADSEKTFNQQVRAKQNKISDRTQRKIDKIAKLDPILYRL